MKNDDNDEQESQEIRAPSWLSKPERRSFLALIGERSAGNRRLSTEEIDLLCDYISARSRLATLHRLWRRTVREDYRTAADIAALARQIDAATAACRRLAKGLAMPTGARSKKDGGDRSKAGNWRLTQEQAKTNAAGLSPSGRRGGSMRLNVETTGDVR